MYVESSPSEKTFIDFLRNGFSRFARFFLTSSDEAKFSSVLESRGAGIYSRAGEREEMMAKKEIFCSCVLHREASHYKPNNTHLLTFWGDGENVNREARVWVEDVRGGRDFEGKGCSNGQFEFLLLSKDCETACDNFKLFMSSSLGQLLRPFCC